MASCPDTWNGQDPATPPSTMNRKTDLFLRRRPSHSPCRWLSQSTPIVSLGRSSGASLRITTRPARPRPPASASARTTRSAFWRIWAPTWLEPCKSFPKRPPHRWRRLVHGSCRPHERRGSAGARDDARGVPRRARTRGPELPIRPRRSAGEDRLVPDRGRPVGRTTWIHAEHPHPQTRVRGLPPHRRRRAPHHEGRSPPGTRRGRDVVGGLRPGPGIRDHPVRPTGRGRSVAAPAPGRPVPGAFGPARQEIPA